MRLLKEWWPFGVGLLTLAAAGLTFADQWQQLVMYRVVFYYASESTLALACLIIPLLLVILSCQWYRLKRRESQPRRVLALGASVLLLLVANFLACGALPRQLAGYHPLSRTEWGNSVYRLDTLLSGVWSDLGEDLLLWECDRSGWFCRVIYAQEYDDTMMPTLTVDRQINTLSLLIHNKVVYTHQP